MRSTGESRQQPNEAVPEVEAPVAAGDNVSLDDPRVHQAMEAYLRLLQAGEQPDREAFLARYPEVAKALAICLQGLDFVHAAGVELSHSAAGGGDGEATETPECLGDFRIVREVGRGGMGVVYEAVQLSLGRRVALKVLPFAATMDSRQLQRFQNEARAAASLEHPHIVPVYGVGCERGVHYFAMKFIEGHTLAALIEEQRTGSSGPVASEATTAYVEQPVVDAKGDTLAQAATTTAAAPRDAGHFRRVAEWGIQAAEALEYAHSLGIVHRDIKPANLMVDGDARLWVTDFGLARTAADTGLTMTGDLLGTLRYMSPEQALARHGLVDHRADIYGLGVTLYELLTLRPAVQGEDRQEILQRIAMEEPGALRKINKTIPADLETIVLKALAKDPPDRYGTAAELLQDLDRFLADRPIQARRPTLLKRVSKLARRHKPMVATLIAFALLTMAGLTTSVVLISQQRDRAAEEAGQAQQQRRRAVRNLQTALDGFEDTYVRWSQRYLTQQRPGPRERELLTGLLTFYERFVQANGSDPTLRHETARAQGQLADLHDKLGNEAEAIEAGKQAIRLFQELVRDFPDVVVYKQNLRMAYLGQSNRYLSARLLPEAENLVHECQPFLDELLVSEASDAESLSVGSQLLDNLGLALVGMGQHDKAAAAYHQALALNDKLISQFPDNPAYRRSRGAILNNQAKLCLKQGDLGRARPLLEQAIVEQRFALTRTPDDPVACMFLRNHWTVLAQVLSRQNEHPAAEKAYKEALAGAVILAKEHPGVFQYRQALALSHSNLAMEYLRTDRGKAAEAALRKSVALWDQLRHDFPNQQSLRRNEADARYNLAGSLVLQGKTREALEQYRTAVRLQPRDPDANYRLAVCSLEQPSLSDADLKEAMAAARTLVAVAPDDPRFWNVWAQAQRQAGNWKEVIVGRK